MGKVRPAGIEHDRSSPRAPTGRAIRRGRTPRPTPRSPAASRCPPGSDGPRAWPRSPAPFGPPASHPFLEVRREPAARRFVVIPVPPQGPGIHLSRLSEKPRPPHWLKANTVKRRTHSLFRQGLMLYHHLPNWPEDRIRPLMETSSACWPPTGCIHRPACRGNRPAIVGPGNRRAGPSIRTGQALTGRHPGADGTTGPVGWDSFRAPKLHRPAVLCAGVHHDSRRVSSATERSRMRQGLRGPSAWRRCQPAVARPGTGRFRGRPAIRSRTRRDGISCRRDARSASMGQAHARAATRRKSPWES